MPLITVYARREPTRDSLSRSLGLGHKLDIAIYRDRACTVLFACFPWYYRRKPCARSKSVVLNCYRWALEWVAPRAEAHGQ